jgi:GNAT superfamily N-acetyltransferase
MSKDFVSRLAEPKDIAAVSRFRTTLFEYDPGWRSRGPEYYRWKYFENPYSNGELWITEYGGQIVGMIGMTPKHMILGNKPVSGAEIGDTFTHPDFQRKGIFTRLLRLSDRSIKDKGIDFIYGTPNALALPGYIRKHNYVIAPLKTVNLMKVLDARKLFGVPLVGAVFNTVLKLVWRRGVVEKKIANITIDVALKFPPLVNDLWQAVSEDYSVAIIRNRQYLTWRYVTSPDPYLILVAHDNDPQSKEIKGFLVAVQARYKQYSTYRIADYLTTRDDGNTFRALLSYLVSQANEDGAVAISATSIKGNYYYRILRKMGFIPRNNITVICDNPDEIIKPYAGKIRHFTLGDSDNI